MRRWPTHASRNQPPPALYLHQRGHGARNQLVVANLQGRQVTGTGVIARVKQRLPDAAGSRYEEQIVHDAESGRGRFQSEVRKQ